MPDSVPESRSYTVKQGITNALLYQLSYFGVALLTLLFSVQLVI